MKMQIRTIKELSLQFIETGTVIDYLKAYHNLGSETQKMQILAKTMTAAFKRK